MLVTSKLCFIGIGAPICGTTWLYQNLRRHPSVWMSWIKEFHYFDSQREEGFASPWHKQHTRNFGRFLVAKLLSRELDLDLFWWYKYLRGSRSDEWYASLFQGRKEAVCGEITPRYSSLDAGVISDIATLFPDLKIILLTRDPIERTWSYASKMLAQQRGRHMSDVCHDEIMTFLGRIPGGCDGWNDYLAIFDRWNEHFAEERIFLGFHDDLARDAKKFFDSVCEFLEIPCLETSQFQFLDEKIGSTDAYRMPIPADVEREIASRTITQIEALSDRFAGPPSRWLARARASLA